MMSSASVSLSLRLSVVGSAVITSRTFNFFMLASPKAFYRLTICDAPRRLLKFLRGVASIENNRSKVSTVTWLLSATLGDLHNASEFWCTTTDCDYRFRLLGALSRHPT